MVDIMAASPAKETTWASGKREEVVGQQLMMSMDARTREFLVGREADPKSSAVGEVGTTKAGRASEVSLHMGQ